MIKIGNKFIGNTAPVFIVAEMSANHMRDLSVVLRLIKEAAKAGADAFKIQTLTPDTMTIDCDNEYFQISNGTPWDGKSLIELYQETPLPYEWHGPIFDACRAEGLICFSTPYDVSAANFLKQFEPELYKISSFEIFDTPLIQHIAGFGKPMVISTGIAEMDDIENALAACHSVGNRDVIFLKCTSAYPAPLHEINLRTMKDMAERFDVLVGVSDHTLEPETSLASIALGGCFIEKHFTLDRKLGGPDASFSIEPPEFASLVRMVRNTEKILGQVEYRITEQARKNRIFSRSLFVVKDIKKGELITAENVRSIRPGYGLKPSAISKILGKNVNKNVVRGTPVSWDFID